MSKCEICGAPGVRVMEASTGHPMTFDLPMERVAAAGRTDITTPATARGALHVDPAEAHAREVEIGKLAAQLRVDAQMTRRLVASKGDGGISGVLFERGARAGLTAYRECYELVRLMESLWADPSDTNYDPVWAGLAAAALESANG